jgi:hypothetical protein
MNIAKIKVGKKPKNTETRKSIETPLIILTALLKNYKGYPICYKARFPLVLEIE